MGINNKPTFVTLFITGMIAGLIMTGMFIPVQVAYDKRIYINKVKKYQAEIQEKKDSQRKVLCLQYQLLAKDKLPVMANMIKFRGVTYLVKM